MKIETNQHYTIFRKINVNKKSKLNLDGQSHREKCSLTGALALAFRISQVVGVAPLKFVKKLDGYEVCVSLPQIAWSYLVAAVWILSSCIALINDLSEPPEMSVRASTTTRRFVWIFDFIIVTLIAVLGVYRAPIRTKAVLRCLEQLQKINRNMNVPRSKKSKVRMDCFILTFFGLLSVAVALSDFFFSVRLARHKTYDQVRSTYLYFGYYYGYVTLFALEMQFMCCAIKIYKTIKYLNDLLEDNSKGLLQKTQGLLFSNIGAMPTKTYNHTVDTMLISDLVYAGVAKNSTKTASEMIRHLSLMYSNTCDIVRQLNESFAHELLVLLMSFLLHLVVTPYNCIVNVSGESINAHKLAMQVSWIVVHLTCTVAVVEPCYATQKEMSRTQLLVSQLMLQNSDVLIRDELNAFGTYLNMNNVVYSPMGICVLSRPLVASILASVTTYLVIMIQFQATESKT